MKKKKKKKSAAGIMEQSNPMPQNPAADLETYLANSRKKKVRLLLLRLLYPMGLPKAQEKDLKSYLIPLNDLKFFHLQ